MKKSLLPVILSLLFTTGNISAQHTLVKKWETDSVFKTPESVLYDGRNQLLYVANMNPDQTGQGSIGKLAPDGRLITAEWVTGLTSPKGMGLYKDMLYVAELTDVAVIDTRKGTIVKRIPVAGAAFLNDITIDKKGTVYVSDSRTLKVYRIEKNKPAVLLQNLQGPNGLLSVEDELLVLDKGSLVKLLANNQLTSLATGMDPSTDGVERVQKGEYIISSWSGVLYYVFENGNKQTLLDTRPQKISSADIGYDAKNRIVYVPTFFKNSVAAYQLQ